MQSDIVRVAVVGLGNWGKNVARSFAAAPRCRLARLCESEPSRRAHQHTLYPEAIASPCFEDVLSDPQIDAVAVVTPAPLHFEMAQAALAADKHVFVEKPLALVADQAAELIELADERRRKLMVGHLLEYHPAVELMKQYVEQEELGAIHYMYCQRLNLGVVRQTENAFWSLAPHDISVILHLFGAEPDRVTASGACFLQPGIDDVVFANLHFPDGRIAGVHVSWLDPHKARKMVLVGSRKMLVFDDMHPSEKIRVFDKGAQLPEAAEGTLAPINVRHGEIHIPHLSSRPPLDIEAEHFVECILEDRTPRSDGRDGLRVVRVLEQVDRQLHETEVSHKRVATGAMVRAGEQSWETSPGGAANGSPDFWAQIAARLDHVDPATNKPSRIAPPEMHPLESQAEG
jgi:predicted dehydrogenase